jgi:hypothetical protein
MRKTIVLCIFFCNIRLGFFSNSLMAIVKEGFTFFFIFLITVYLQGTRNPAQPHGRVIIIYFWTTKYIYIFFKYFYFYYFLLCSYTKRHKISWVIKIIYYFIFLWTILLLNYSYFEVLGKNNKLKGT